LPLFSSLERVALTQAQTYGRPLAGGHSWPRRKMADDSAQDWADRIGRHVSTAVIAALAMLFAYAFLGRLVFG
jgi:hypothetical protein